MFDCRQLYNKAINHVKCSMRRRLFIGRQVFDDEMAQFDILLQTSTCIEKLHYKHEHIPGQAGLKELSFLLGPLRTSIAVASHVTRQKRL